MPMHPSLISFFRKFLLQEAGMNLDKGKEYLLQTRLAPLLGKDGLKDLEALAVRLRGPRGPLHDKVLERLTTNETLFFRERSSFAALTGKVFPDLLNRRPAKEPLRVWSAAAATGQEAYSIAIALREAFPAQSLRVSITASDLSRTALEKAASGGYRNLEVRRGLPVALRERYFFQDNGAWRVSPAIRKMVEFERINLAGDWPSLPRFDIVFLCNVLIYIDMDVRHRILRKMADVLRPDGFLFVSGVESPFMLKSAFSPVQDCGAPCYVPGRVPPGRDRSDAVTSTKPSARSIAGEARSPNADQCTDSR